MESKDGMREAAELFPKSSIFENGKAVLTFGRTVISTANLRGYLMENDQGAGFVLFGAFVFLLVGLPSPAVNCRTIVLFPAVTRTMLPIASRLEWIPRRRSTSRFPTFAV